MYTLFETRRKGNRLYLTLLCNGMSKLTFKMYSPDRSLDERLSLLMTDAANASIFNMEETDDIETLCSRMDSSRILDEFEDCGINLLGIYDDSINSNVRLTPLGRSSFAYYRHTRFYVESLSLCVSPSKENITETMLGEIFYLHFFPENQLLLSQINKAKRSIQDDEKSNGTIHSIDTIEELIQYKYLGDEEMDILKSAGMIEGTQANKMREVATTDILKDAWKPLFLNIFS